jgi:hypothetical protein
MNVDELLSEMKRLHAKSQAQLNRLATGIAMLETLKISSLLNNGTVDDVVKAVQEMMRE